MMRFLLLAGSLLFLSACGQKGALYLPEAGKPPPGANQPACASCAPIKVPSSDSTDTQPSQEPKVILQPEAIPKSDKTKDKDTSTDTNTSTTDSTQETTQ